MNAEITMQTPTLREILKAQDLVPAWLQRQLDVAVHDVIYDSWKAKEVQNGNCEHSNP